MQWEFANSSCVEWVNAQLGQICLGDKRRGARAAKIAVAFAECPGYTIPQIFDRKSDVNAAYVFFDRPEANPDALQALHRDQVRRLAGEPGSTTLFVEDGSDFSWSGKAPVARLGPIGTGADGLQGFVMHSTIALAWPGIAPRAAAARRPPVRILGLADQRFHVRSPRQGKRDHSRERSQTTERLESHLWEETVQRLGPAPKATRWVRVFDRAGDIYENLTATLAAGWGFVGRALNDHALIDPATAKPADQLFAAARAAKPLGRFQLFLRARPHRPAHNATLTVAAVPVALRSPARPGLAAGARPPVECFAVRVWEARPPAGVKPLGWLLLTDRPVWDFDAALETALQYSTRWIIEEFHKALKTGMRVEKLQLQTAERLFAAIALMSFVAFRLIDLRERLRVDPQALARESGLDPTQLLVLSSRLNRHLKTVRDVALAVGRLGGHMNRNSDGMPGWVTLWRGMRDLHFLTEGYLLYEKVHRLRE